MIEDDGQQQSTPSKIKLLSNFVGEQNESPTTAGVMVAQQQNEHIPQMMVEDDHKIRYEDDELTKSLEIQNIEEEQQSYGLSNPSMMEEEQRRFIPTICQKSREMVETKLKGKAHNRLFGKAKVQKEKTDFLKEMALIQKQKKDRFHLTENPEYEEMNTGERLYNRMKLKKGKMSRKAKRELQRREEKEIESASFTPTINRESQHYKRSYR